MPSRAVGEERNQTQLSDRIGGAREALRNSHPHVFPANDVDEFQEDLTRKGDPDSDTSLDGHARFSQVFAPCDSFTTM